MTPEQDERLKRVESLMEKLLAAVLEEDEEEPGTSLDGDPVGASREPTTSLD